MKDALQSFLIALVTSVAVLFGLGPIMMKLNPSALPPPAAPIPATTSAAQAALPSPGGAPGAAPAGLDDTAIATAPNIEGMLVRDARERWREQGILIIEDRTRVDSTHQAGTILEQTPRAGVVLKQKELRVIVAVQAELRSVPNVAGQSLDEARATLEAAGFEVPDPVTKTSEKPGGTVLEQEPEPGTRSDKGASVRLTVAASLVEVPKLRNQRLSQAREALEEAGLALGKVSEQEDEELSGGRVLSQSPDAGDEVEPGSTVDLVVVAPD